MRSTILLLASLLATSFALPQSSKRQQSGTDALFVITDYNPGCGDSPAGCLFSFNLTIYKYGDSPSSTTIITSCDGTDIQGDTFGSCVGQPNITSHEDFLAGNWSLSVNHTYSDGYGKIFKDVGRVNVTDFENAGQNFIVRPTTTVVKG